jgi:hypothetical protein
MYQNVTAVNIPKPIHCQTNAVPACEGTHEEERESIKEHGAHNAAEGGRSYSVHSITETIMRAESIGNPGHVPPVAVIRNCQLGCTWCTQRKRLRGARQNVGPSGSAFFDALKPVLP